jgi:hypothetical protein
MLTYLVGPRVFHHILLIDSEIEQGLEADHNVMELRHCHLSHQVSALELHQPGILQGVCAQWPVQLRKHCMTPKLEAGEEEIGLLQMFFSSLSADQVGGCEQNWREKQLQPSLPISLVHLKHQLLYGEVGARGVLL